MVDTVLYFEGDRGHTYRILRAVKNRFGATDEIGVFEMASGGLREVANPSELFLGDREASSPGAAVFAGIEGTRPLLVEIQALVAPSALGTPRRAVVGWDANRLVDAARRARGARRRLVRRPRRLPQRRRRPAESTSRPPTWPPPRRCFHRLSGVAIPRHRVHFGEVSLSGAVNATPLMGPRLKEAQKLGFRQACCPPRASSTARGIKLKLRRIAPFEGACRWRRRHATDRQRLRACR